MNRWNAGACVILAAALAVSFGSVGSGPGFDVLIKNGRIVDGTGNPWFYGDIGIRGDTIAAVGSLAGKTAVRTIDAAGMVVAPGFIDVHTHCDQGFAEAGANANLNYLTQGVTTVITGNCGNGTFRIADTKSAWEKQGLGTNAVPLVGFGTIRKEVLGVADRAPSTEELERMKSILRQAMSEGAWGMSTGLQYIPDRYAGTEEVIALTKVVGEFGGIYASHQRDEEAHLVEAVAETIRIGKETGVRVDASHFKAAGRANWGLLKEAVSLINQARAEGIEMTADMYPYDKAATAPLLALFNVPPGMEPFATIEKKAEAQTPSTLESLRSILNEAADALAGALADPPRKAKIRQATMEGDPAKVNWVKTWGWHNFSIVSAKKNTSLIGKILSDLAKEQGRDPFDVISDLFIQEKNDIVISLAAMSEADMKLAMVQDWLMFSSDGTAVAPGQGTGHPRDYGSFPRVLQKYVGEEKTLTLEQAVRKMSSLPAHLFRLKDRGLLLEGFKADLVVFDPSKVREKATYLNPNQYSSGLEYVLVNGKPAIDNGRFNNTLEGLVLLRPKS
jgi:N-acyl-D-amino-acid deacylase